ncbi:MAG: glycosyltransferase family 4 protein [Salinivirgaceae bacterium]|nr:glycosyltransferase family 4 protein [Salinivirgaceae bacterium]
MKKPKVLLIQESLMNYRDPIYSLINEQVDLTVGYTTATNYTDASYPIIQLPYRMIGKLIWHKHLRRIINQYDVVVFVPHFRMIRVATLSFFPHKPKLVTWSLGVHASRTRLYNLSKKPDIEDKIFETIQDHADACVFYMSDPIEYWKKYRKIDDKKYFVAHNTVAVAPFDESESKDKNIILFVGTLYKQKGVGELIDCYAKAKKKVGKLPALKIIGKGPEKDSIEQHIKTLGIEEDVELTGAIYDENILKNYFVKSIVCVSPKQAGLSVLKSLGYGVPFVSRTDAITGGEKANIVNGQTGLFYESENELVDILVKTTTEPEMFAAMSKAARSYYLKEASPEGMAQGVIDAIYYAYSK